MRAVELAVMDYASWTGMYASSSELMAAFEQAVMDMEGE